MTFRTIILILLLLNLINCNKSFGQLNNNIAEIREKFDNQYGLNSELYNGKKYYPPHTNAKGHPYLKTEKAQNGTLILNNKRYNNLNLKYNIYMQQIVLNYKQKSGAFNQIIISNSRIDTLKFQGGIFIQNKFNDIRTPIIQVISEGKYSMYLSWQKEYSFKAEVSGGSHIYSKEKRKIYLVINSVVNVKNKKSLLNAFNLENRDEIKQFIKANKIRIRKASEFQLRQLMEYCNENI